MHPADAPHVAASITDSERRAARSIQHDASVYRSWIASGTAVPIDDWMQIQRELDKEMRIKQEEMDQDPLADLDIGCGDLVGAGNACDPIIID